MREIHNDCCDTWLNNQVINDQMSVIHVIILAYLVSDGEWWCFQYLFNSLHECICR